MMDPHANISDITLNDPRLAVPLLDFMLWCTTTPDVTKTSDYDEILDFLYSKSSHFRAARDEYIQARVAA
jgi:hypothetical protein